ncbi:MAG: A/G-specific adenine glycosylase [Gammaproteobacteria bacterium]
MRQRLLRWGSSHRAAFPWRGKDASPFTILVSELLLRKTRRDSVAALLPRLLKRFPDPSALAHANKRQLQTMLRPLGLHRIRAAGLVRLGIALLKNHRGKVPTSLKDLLALPHVGRYGAHAVRCFAFGEPDPIVDTNVARVLGRYYGITRLAQLHTDDQMWEVAGRVVARTRSPRQLNWAILDLGATVCLARLPRCDACPLSSDCRFARDNSRTRN